MKHPPSAMATNTSLPVTEDELHALIDGQLTAPERQALEARLAQDAKSLATLHAWRAQRDALRGLHGELLQEPVPTSLLAAARQAAQARQQIDQWWRWGGMAAGVVMAFGVGWLSHGQWQAQSSQPLAQQQISREFVHQAALAHAVYSPEVRHPVEVSAAQQEHLVQWLSKRLGKPLKVPNLSAQGFELVGGRLLPGDEGARAQFMFQNPAGTRITLYLGALDAGAPGQGDTAFRFHTEGPVPGFYWADQGFGYALSGQVSREQLLQLARAVHAQI